MISKLAVENFKCLQRVEVDLAPLTILVGPNDSGKTSVLDALRILGASTRAKLPELFPGDTLVDLTFEHQHERSLRWHVAGNDRHGVAFEYELQVGGGTAPEVRAESIRTGADGQAFTISPHHRIARVSVPDVGTFEINLSASTVLAVGAMRGARAWYGLVTSLWTSDRYHFDPDALRKPAVPQQGARLTPSGDNLAAVLDQLLSGLEREKANQLQDDIHRVVPTLKSVATPASTTSGADPGAKEIVYRLATPTALGAQAPIGIPAKHASDGALLLTAFLVLAHTESPDILLIEEPENGLHPSRIEDVVTLLRQISRGEVGGRARQVIVTTHSPLLVNYALPEELRIVTRDPVMGTSVKPVHESEKKLLDEFGLGELWYLAGEEHLANGQP